jgi:GTP-binding nuclear protein Ran
MTTKTPKIVLIGDGGVGKSTYVNRLTTGDFRKKYIPTMGVEVRPMNYDGQVVNLWDCAGQEKFSGLKEGYYTGADGAIAMFDVTSKLSYRNLPSWIDAFMSTAPGVPLVICGNKVDCKERKVKPRNIHIHQQYEVPYWDLSAKSNYNFEKPIKYFAELYAPVVEEVQAGNILRSEATQEQIGLSKL